jgi:RNA-binding protein YhbY
MVQINIGKEGVTEGALAEIKKELKRGDVKVKLLKNYLQANDRHETAQKLKELLSVRVKLTGNVLTISKGN